MMNESFVPSNNIGLLIRRQIPQDQIVTPHVIADHIDYVNSYYDTKVHHVGEILTRSNRFLLFEVYWPQNPSYSDHRPLLVTRVVFDNETMKPHVPNEDFEWEQACGLYEYVSQQPGFYHLFGEFSWDIEVDQGVATEWQSKAVVQYVRVI